MALRKYLSAIAANLQQRVHLIVAIRAASTASSDSAAGNAVIRTAT
jgi:hypothetical protein